MSVACRGIFTAMLPRVANRRFGAGATQEIHQRVHTGEFTQVWPSAMEVMAYSCQIGIMCIGLQGVPMVMCVRAQPFWRGWCLIRPFDITILYHNLLLFIDIFHIRMHYLCYFLLFCMFIVSGIYLPKLGFSWKKHLSRGPTSRAPKITKKSGS